MEHEILSEGPCRESAKKILERRIERMDRRTEALRILYLLFPWDKLSKEEDEILWSYFTTVG